MADNINDGDSQMHSSPSDEGDDTELMFPSATNPPTPPRQTQAFQPTVELSPPTSQDPREDLEMGNSMDTTVTSTNGIDTLLNRNNVQTADSGYSEKGFPSGRKSDEENQPGYAWKNKRAQDDYSRTIEQVVDKKWSLRDFGDPFDERDMEI